MLAVAARGDQGDAAFAFLGLADDPLAHLGIGFAQRGQFFLDSLNAFDFEAEMLQSGPSIPAPSKSLIFHGAMIKVTLPSVR